MDLLSCEYYYCMGYYKFNYFFQFKSEKGKKMKFKFTFLFVIIILSTLLINTESYSQAQRKVIFEKWTSSTCGPCASQNPSWHAWSLQYWDTITTVAYHVGWPSPGNDPMYLHNPTQSYDRRYYYGINSVPCAMVDGLQMTGGCAGCSYSNSETCLGNYYRARRNVSTPVAISVVDTRIAGDSIKADITVTLLSNLPAGNYYLRVMAIEHLIKYATPPGTNGETQFPDVFRKSFPTSTGTLIQNTAGTYNFTFKYKIDPVWVNLEMYTLAFVQNDGNKEVMNSGRPLTMPTGIKPYSNEVAGNYQLLQNFPNPFNPSTYIAFVLPKDEHVNLEVFDMLGNSVKVLVDGNHRAGTYNIFFDGEGLASGVYFYKLTAGSFTETKKMMLMK